MIIIFSLRYSSLISSIPSPKKSKKKLALQHQQPRHQQKTKRHPPEAEATNSAGALRQELRFDPPGRVRLAGLAAGAAEGVHLRQKREKSGERVGKTVGKRRKNEKNQEKMMKNCVLKEFNHLRGENTSEIKQKMMEKHGGLKGLTLDKSITSE